MVSALDYYVGGPPFKFGILPLLKHTSPEGRLAAMLAVEKSAGVIPEVNLRELTSCNVWLVQIILPTLALKPRGDVTRRS